MAGGLEAFKKEVMPAKGEYTGPQTIRKTGLAAGTSYSVCVLGISKSGSDSGSRRHRRPKRPNKRSRKNFITDKYEQQ